MSATKNVYAADFETRNAPSNIRDGVTSVWLWDLCNVWNNEHTTGRSIESFMEECERIAPAIVYFHNLAFDGSFILYYLLTHKQKQVIKKPRDKHLNDGEFTALILESGKMYQIKIRTQNGYVEFRDSSKKIKYSVKKIAQKLQLPEQKGEIDYLKERPADYEPTAEELEYIRTDTQIVARVAREFHEHGMTKLSIASDAMKIYKDRHERVMRYLFPTLGKETNEFIREAYRGGACQAKQEIIGKRLKGDIRVYDINSSYAHVMEEYPLPFGPPKRYTGKYSPDEIFPLFIQEVRVSCRLKHGHFPAILLKNFRLLWGDYLKDTGAEMITLTLTNVDLDLLFEHYEVFDIQYTRGLAFRASVQLFHDFLPRIYDWREHGTLFEQLVAKDILTSFSGKFASRPFANIKTAMISPTTGELKYMDAQSAAPPPVYIALSAFVTAWARRELYNAISKNLSRVVYFDTDSIHTIGPADGLDIDRHRLGAWKEEEKAHTAKYVGPKSYIMVTNDREIKRIAGATDKLKESITLENFVAGTRFLQALRASGKKSVREVQVGSPKLRPQKVKGGTILKPISFTIKKGR